MKSPAVPTKRFALLALLVVLLAGCGRSTYTVRGKVVFPDGTPLEGGWVVFHKSEGESEVSADGPIQANGTFELRTNRPGDGVPPGTYRVLVKPRERNKKERLTLPLFIDPKFERFETSGIVLTVEAKENDFEIRVAKPPR
jgi:hypothetical protein